MEQAFNAAKTALAAAAELKHPQADFPISLMVDMSGTQVGTVLQHFHCSSWAPLSFSKLSPPAESHYDQNLGKTTTTINFKNILYNTLSKNTN